MLFQWFGFLVSIYLLLGSYSLCVASVNLFNLQKKQNKGRNGTNNGLFRKLHVCEESCKPRKFLESCEKIVRKLWESCEKVMRRLWENCEKVVRKLIKSCEKVVRKLWESWEKSVKDSC